jgi:hypothetical protein
MQNNPHPEIATNLLILSSQPVKKRDLMPILACLFSCKESRQLYLSLRCQYPGNKCWVPHSSPVFGLEWDNGFSC